MIRDTVAERKKERQVKGEEIKKTLALKWTLTSKLIMNNRTMVFSFILLFKYRNLYNFPE